ncbi:unnamed protein product [Penicillium nalgiovense]|uniref:Uncharacterized protein n=1 Tax=Penicillium nalgiovense TaxID=60175 RepID=A0A9W4HUK9_PENNA|nr:unnamed protein product [Penicillium nalgiovense]CAG7988964.1 unnamed protein product [Penicillium nalgiovense]CAG8012201.1 unnamed protein product [Penicillium nalgiovense]CAG8037264.1 unnamed protein product [Penicillium nalgiovense]CAG8047402.1 unnamed protein product [Penicillium nalgiovense]
MEQSSNMSSLNITLRGHYTATRFPEQAMVHLTIESTGESEATITHEVTSTCNDLHASLETLRPIQEDGTTSSAVSSISASEMYMTTKNRNAYDSTETIYDSPRIYNAIITFYVVFCDFNELHKFIQKVDGYPNARLNNLIWYLTDATKGEIGAESRKKAVLDAVTKADQYAKAVGFEDVIPVDIREIDESLNPAALPQKPTFRHPSGVSLTPQDIVLNCCVQVVFGASCDLASGARTD